MIISVISSIVLMKRRSMTEIFPQRLRDLWKEWELRALVFISLMSQIVLIILGSRRKHNPRLRIACAVWCAYLLADAVATMGLGILLNNLGEIFEHRDCAIDADNELTAFWAPFFLLHLGGPDTITAYSLEDNELYLRHAFGLLIQTVATIYIFLLAWSGSHLSFLAVPMIFVGCIKYGERTWALFLASGDQLRDSMLSDPDAGPSYPKFMDKYSLKHAEGFYVVAQEVERADQVEIVVSADETDSKFDAKAITTAYDLFQRFKCLFADLILSFQDRDYSRSLFQKMSWQQAFNVIDIELGFMYDLLYTKATVIHSPWGFARRIITTSLTSLVLVIFCFADKQKYTKVDLSITFLLLIVAILLEIYAALALLVSDSSRLWFSKHKIDKILNAIIDHLAPVLEQPRWSETMGQYSVTSLCLKEKHGLISKIPRLLHMEELWQEHWYKTYKKVPDELKTLLFKHVNRICGESKGESSGGKGIDRNRQSRVLEQYKFASLDWSIDCEFDKSILIWHIATTLCYYSAYCTIISDRNYRKLSKFLSRYMIFLLVVYPSLLPVGIGLIRFRDTCSEANKFFKERMPIYSSSESTDNTDKVYQIKERRIQGHSSSESTHNTDKAYQRKERRIQGCSTSESTHNTDKVYQRKKRRIEGCIMLVNVKTYVSPNKVKGDRSKSVLFDACKLAAELNKISDEERWKLITDVWLETLTYAASQGRGSQHARRLRRGGELLTHVWFLLAHFGMTEQFQISQGHSTAKLIAK